MNTTTVHVRPGVRYRGIMPHSEVCMHMKVAGKLMSFEVLPDRPAVQLYTDDGRPFSSSILTGEAGVMQDEKGYYHKDCQRFGVVEYTNHFEVVDHFTGNQCPMGDGVDSLFKPDGKSYKPGTPGFTTLWADALNENAGETQEAYFPDYVDWAEIYLNAECPDCGEPIPATAVEGDHCENCEHVFVTEHPDDDEDL